MLLGETGTHVRLLLVRAAGAHFYSVTLTRGSGCGGGGEGGGGASPANPNGQSCQPPFSASEDRASEGEGVHAEEKGGKKEKKEKKGEVAAENESEAVIASKQDATSV